MGSMGSRVGLRVTSKRIYVRGPFQDCCCLCPNLHGKPLPTQTSTRSPSTWAGRSGSISCGVTVYLSPGSWYAQYFVCAIQGWSLCILQSCESPIIKSHWPSKSDSLVTRSLFIRSLGWEAWREVQNLHNNGRTSLGLLFSGLWATHLVGMGFDFIVTVPFLSSCCGFFFVFGLGVFL